MSSQRIKNTELIKPHYDCTLEVIAYNSRPNCDKLDKLKCCLNIIKHENSVFAANFVWQADKKYSIAFIDVLVVICNLGS